MNVPRKFHPMNTNQKKRNHAGNFVNESKYKKEELIRLSIEMLKDLGLPHSARSVQEESKIKPPCELSKIFSKSIMDANWEFAEKTINQFGIDSCLLQKIIFLIKKQKFLETLAKQNTLTAVQILRNEITPLKYDQDELHKLASFILCQSRADLAFSAEFEENEMESRHNLLVQIQGTLI